MKKIAIITGASAGLGRHFVETVARERNDLAEIWLIARRKNLLAEIQRQYPQRKFKLFPLDLTAEASYSLLRTALLKEKPTVALLINDAGMVASGSFQTIALAKQQAMIELNAKAPVTLTYEVFPYLKRDSQIINVCSVAGFAPTPNLLTYSSTKAFLYQFTKGLHAELRPQGIKVLALCPGNMATEMFTPTSDLPKEKSVINCLPFLDLETVTTTALKKVAAGRMVYTPNLIYKSYRGIAKLLPHKLLMYFSKV